MTLWADSFMKTTALAEDVAIAAKSTTLTATAENVSIVATAADARAAVHDGHGRQAGAHHTVLHRRDV
jgi:hypothetical protein